MKLWAPIEIFKQRMNLTKLDLDQEVRKYALQAQTLIEQMTGRGLDASETVTHYVDGGFDFILLPNYPIRSITGIYEDVDREWASDTEVLSDDRFIDDGGAVYKRSGNFTEGNRTIKATYKGGYYPLQTVVALATPGSTMTIAEALTGFADTFQIFVKTTGTNTAGTIAITGTDVNGDSKTETITPDAVRLAAGKVTVSVTETLFKTITVVNSSSLGATGSVAVYASNVPRDLILCAEIIAAHFFLQDFKGVQGIGQQNYETASEGNIVQDIPAEAKQIIQKYRSYI